MKIKLTILIACIILLSLNAFSQRRNITQADLFKATFDANKVSETIFPKRVIAESKDFENGKLTSSSVITSDYDSDGNQRVVNIHKTGSKTETKEMIKIGDVYYCRNNKAAWKKTSQFCGEMKLSAPPNTKTSRITSEEVTVGGKKATHYSSYIAHSGWLGGKVDDEPLRFIQSEFWVNNDGSSQKWEESRGFVESKALTRKSSTVIYYKVKVPKIIAPIK